MNRARTSAYFPAPTASSLAALPNTAARPASSARFTTSARTQREISIPEKRASGAACRNSFASTEDCVSAAAAARIAVIEPGLINQVKFLKRRTGWTENSY